MSSLQTLLTNIIHLNPIKLKNQIANELSSYKQFVINQIVEISKYYQTQQKYQNYLYTEEVAQLRQEIQRQYRVIQLMKDQFQELMVLLNRKSFNNNQSNNAKQQQQPDTYQQNQQKLTQSYQMNIFTSNQTQLYNKQQQNIKHQQQFTYQTSLSNQHSNIVSSLQVIMQEQTQRTLMSINSEHDQNYNEMAFCQNSVNETQLLFGKNQQSSTLHIRIQQQENVVNSAIFKQENMINQSRFKQKNQINQLVIKQESQANQFRLSQPENLLSFQQQVPLNTISSQVTNHQRAIFQYSQDQHSPQQNNQCPQSYYQLPKSISSTNRKQKVNKSKSKSKQMIYYRDQDRQNTQKLSLLEDDYEEDLSKGIQQTKEFFQYSPRFSTGEHIHDQQNHLHNQQNQYGNQQNQHNKFKSSNQNLYNVLEKMIMYDKQNCPESKISSKQKLSQKNNISSERHSLKDIQFSSNISSNNTNRNLSDRISFVKKKERNFTIIQRLDEQQRKQKTNIPKKSPNSKHSLPIKKLSNNQNKQNIITPRQVAYKISQKSDQNFSSQPFSFHQQKSNQFLEQFRKTFNNCLAKTTKKSSNKFIKDYLITENSTNKEDQISMIRLNTDDIQKESHVQDSIKQFYQKQEQKQDYRQQQKHDYKQKPKHNYKQQLIRFQKQAERSLQTTFGKNQHFIQRQSVVSRKNSFPLQNITSKKNSVYICSSKVSVPTTHQSCSSNPNKPNPSKQIQLLQSLYQQSHLKFQIGSKKLQLKYQGQRLQSLRHGQGRLVYSNGLIYQGQFQGGLRHGYGMIKFNHIQLYSGCFYKDQLSGHGKIRNCTIINKKKTSQQKLMSKWISYCGQFRNSTFQGKGVLYLREGQKFVGEFSNGLPMGEGVLYKKNGETIQGQWTNGVLME